MEEQIIGIRKEHEPGAETANVCRKQRISMRTFNRFEGKYAGMEVFGTQCLKALEEESAQPEKLHAEQMDNTTLKDFAARKV